MVAGPPKAAVGSRFQTAPAAVVKSHGGERRGNGSDESGSYVRYSEMSKPEPVLTCRKSRAGIRTGEWVISPG